MQKQTEKGKLQSKL